MNFFLIKLFSDRMAETIKEELNIEQFEIKEEVVSIQEEILPSSTVKDTCTVNLNKDDIKIENADIQGKLHNYSIKCTWILGYLDCAR